MDESILTSVKEALGIQEAYEHFDSQLIMHINSVFMILYELGAGPDDGFSISSKETKWSAYIEDDKNLNLIKSYMYLKVRLLFDPPTTSYLLESINKQIAEHEWRINVYVDNWSRTGGGDLSDYATKEDLSNLSDSINRKLEDYSKKEDLNNAVRVINNKFVDYIRKEDMTPIPPDEIERLTPED